MPRYESLLPEQVSPGDHVYAHWVTRGLSFCTEGIASRNEGGEWKTSTGVLLFPVTGVNLVMRLRNTSGFMLERELPRSPAVEREVIKVGDYIHVAYYFETALVLVSGEVGSVTDAGFFTPEGGLLLDLRVSEEEAEVYIGSPSNADGWKPASISGADEEPSGTLCAESEPVNAVMFAEGSYVRASWCEDDIEYSLEGRVGGKDESGIWTTRSGVPLEIVSTYPEKVVDYRLVESNMHQHIPDEQFWQRAYHTAVRPGDVVMTKQVLTDAILTREAVVSSMDESALYTENGDLIYARESAHPLYLFATG